MQLNRSIEPKATILTNISPNSSPSQPKKQQKGSNSITFHACQSGWGRPWPPRRLPWRRQRARRGTPAAAGARGRSASRAGSGARWCIAARPSPAGWRRGSEDWAGRKGRERPRWTREWALPRSGFWSGWAGYALGVDEERIMCQDWPTTARATLLISILQLNNRPRDFLDIYFYLILFLFFFAKSFLMLRPVEFTSNWKLYL